MHGNISNCELEGETETIGLYQGTTLVVPKPLPKVAGFSPCCFLRGEVSAANKNAVHRSLGLHHRGFLLEAALRVGRRLQGLKPTVSRRLFGTAKAMP